MNQLTPEEEKELLKGCPKGTFTLMLLLGLCMSAGWAYMYFGMFLKHGPVS